MGRVRVPGWGRAPILGRALLATLLLLPAAPAAPAQAAPPTELRAQVPAGAKLETVFDYRTQACETWDVPDAPAHAWKGEDGKVRLLAAHNRARLMIGATLGTVAHDCRVVFESRRSDDPSRYDDMAWLVSPYTLDGRTVYALVHNEFHGHKRRALCPTGDYMACWWNTLTLSVSKDGGRSFDSGRYLAGVPYRFQGNLGRRAGLFAPSNIIQRDGWYYAMAFAEGLGAQKRGVCLMRTRDLADPGSWRGWNGKDFAVSFLDPYTPGATAPETHVCAPVAPDRLPFTVGRLIRHSPTGLTMAVMAGRRAEKPGGQPVSGVWTSTSRDLVNWTKPRLVWAAPLLTDKACAVSEAFYYPSVIDPDARTRNFEDIDGTAYLYMTRLAQSDCKATPRRDLVRIMLRVDPVEGG